MKVLFVLPYLPSPPRFGGQRRLHGLMVEIARRHEVWVATLIDPAEDNTEALAATRAYCRRVIAVTNARHFAGGATKRLFQLGSLIAPVSYENLVYRSLSLQQELNVLLSTEKFDVVQVEFAQMGVFRLPRTGGRPVLCLDEHNIEYEILKRTAAGETGLVRRVYNTLDWRKLRVEELRAWRRFDGCSVTSARDEKLLQADAPGVRTAVVPNGVDVEDFVPGDPAAVEPDTVLFFGAINYYPNTDGILFFLREAWPLLKARRPTARLRIIGPKPPPVIAEWADPSVEVVGYVDDVRAHIARAAVTVVPLRIGGGTRLKVLEAMALGKAIVSTPLGAEGIDVTPEENILLAPDAAGLARQIDRALGDPALSSRLGSEARRLAVERYSWRASADRLVRFYEQLGARVS
jgi:glycosyltransferase involved in cell wall biosynthesis